MKHRKLTNKFLIVLMFPIVIIILMVVNYYIEQPTYQTYSQNTFNQTPTSLGIDVSEHQKEIDWSNIDTNKYNFVIIRTGYGYETDGAIDKYFYDNIKNAKATGLKIGVYHYSYATSVAEAKQEAQYVLKILGDTKLDLPVYFDFEDPIHDTLTNQEMDDITKAFLSVIQDAGYQTGIYANADRLHCLSDSLLQLHDIWIASYGSEPIYNGKVKLWQYTNEGKIDGISTYVDINYGYY